jgi:hypothetical protein
MLLRILRVLFGFLVACLAAGLTIVLFVYTPAELATSDIGGDRWAEAGLLALAAATHSAIFAAPFALIAAVIAEWRAVRSWTYYALAGIVITAIGFLAQYSSEASGDISIFNNYATLAFLATGFAAGLAYWLVAGRWAGAPDSADREEISRPMRPARPPGGAVPRVAS